MLAYTDDWKSGADFSSILHTLTHTLTQYMPGDGSGAMVCEVYRNEGRARAYLRNPGRLMMGGAVERPYMWGQRRCKLNLDGVHSGRAGWRLRWGRCRRRGDGLFGANIELMCLTNVHAVRYYLFQDGNIYKYIYIRFFERAHRDAVQMHIVRCF